MACAARPQQRRTRPPPPPRRREAAACPRLAGLRPAHRPHGPRRRRRPAGVAAAHRTAGGRRPRRRTRGALRPAQGRPRGGVPADRAPVLGILGTVVTGQVLVGRAQRSKRHTFSLRSLPSIHVALKVPPLKRGRIRSTLRGKKGGGNPKNQQCKNKIVRKSNFHFFSSFLVKFHRKAHAVHGVPGVPVCRTPCVGIPNVNASKPSIFGGENVPALV